MSGLIILWIFMGLIIAGAIGVGIYAAVHHSSSGGTLPSNPCSESTSNLTDVSGLACCATSSGGNSSLKYSPDLNMVLAPFPSGYLDVCVGFCDQTPLGPSGTCEGSTGSVALFDQCVDLLAPKMCQGEAMPIGVDGTILYYGYLATGNTCTSCCQCGTSDLCTPVPCGPT